MDEEQKNQDVKLEKMNNANIGDIVEENENEQPNDPEEVEVDTELITDAKIDPHLRET